MRIVSVLCRVFLPLALVAAAGCDCGMHWISEPERDRVIRVRTGDRYYLTLDERDGDRWSAKSDDTDATVTLDHRGDCTVKAEMRIRRGFDGPATVTFTCRRRAGMPPKTFTVSFYKATIDRAFWE